MRANEAMTAAFAAVDACAPTLGAVVADTMDCINLACWDSRLEPIDRLALIDEALLLIAPLKKISGASLEARAALIVEVVRRTTGMLRRYAQLVRGERAL